MIAPFVEKNVFYADITKMMIACGIPLYKLKSVEFKSFFEKYVQESLPDESTLRKNYVKDCYESVLEKIRLEIGESPIFVSIDETTDKAGRSVTNVIVGPLRESGRGYLLPVEVLDKVNSSTIATLCDDSMHILWPIGFQREKVLVFVTDAAPYMKKSASSLKLLYPNMIHITCVAHGVHRVCESLRSKYSDVDVLISNLKKVFLKSPFRVAVFKEMEPNLPLPPQPVITRWGTWLIAAVYYAENYDSIKRIIDQITDDAACVRFSKQLLSKKSVQGNLIYIKCNFGFLLEEKVFERLQKTGTPVGEVLNILDNIEKRLIEAQ
ncbi:uncharacterized protein LOC118751735, partial [Rhagoletis pomonella]|uniref:uncharacterized protein LOC118751735 n=1 Tax=Rhagoletis pomonella TaxID=28610 RepID=UPI00177CE219